ncbi:MAG: ribonucleotide-diphosphate reductase subunit alpha, partial [Novosphingobium sp.]
MVALDELAFANASAPAGDAKALDMNAKDAGSEALVAGMAATVAAAAAAAAPVSDSKKVNPRRFTIVTDDSRDARLTDFGKDTLDDR